MSRSNRPFLIAALLISGSTSLLFGQSPANPSGHWDGVIRVETREITIAIDLAKTRTGALLATFSNPAEHIKGLPLSDVSVDGRSVRFQLKANAGGGTFAGTLSDDGKSIAGTFTTATQQGSVALPFTLTRTGEAVIDLPPKNAAVGKELAGTWNGSIDVGGTQRQVRLTLVNQADGTSSGTIAMAEEGTGIPITRIAQQGASLTLDLRIVGGGYKGTLSADGTELVGTWMQGPNELPLTFRRAPE